MPPARDRRGERFGLLTVVGLPFIHGGRSATPVQCDCGERVIADTDNVVSGRKRSCGCAKGRLWSESTGADGRSKTRLYRIWQKMRARCERPTATQFKWYGGRGIAVCDDWQDFATFRAWAERSGYEDDLEIDRIDNDGPYGPLNCRWVTHAENMANTPRARRIEAFGEIKSASGWAGDDRCVVGESTLRYRIDAGWPAEKALTNSPRRSYYGTP